MKTQYPLVLSALHEMQGSLLYAARKDILASAEQIITHLERLLNEVIEDRNNQRVRAEAAEAALKEAQEQPAVAMVVQRHGAIRIENPDGSYFDVSKHVGAALYARPVPAAPHACHGVPDAGCEYLSPCGSACDKCGKVHNPLSLKFPAAPASAVHEAGEPIYTTEQARCYLIRFMQRHFADQSFGNYISNKLAGDYAWQLAHAIRSLKPAVAVPAVQLAWREAVSEYLAASNAIDLVTKRTGVGCMGSSAVGHEELYRVAAAFHDAKKRLEALLQSSPQAEQFRSSGEDSGV